MSGIVWLICVPLVGAILAFVLPGRFAAVIGVAFALATAVLGGHAAVAVWRDGPQRHLLGGWGAPLGIELYLDGFNALMIAMTAVVAGLISIAAVGYFRHPQHAPAAAAHPRPWLPRYAFWPLWLMLWAAMNIAFLSADLFNLYVALELVGLAAVALMVVGGGTAVLTAAMRYLLVSLLASLGYLLGVAILYAQFGALDIYLLAPHVEAEPTTWIAMSLMTAGLMLKTALFPLHFWLPPAHSSAPAPVSAALSALVVKVSLYLLLRLWFELFPELLSPAIGQLVGVLATAAIVGGSVQAILQRRLKMLVAYSTVAQLGYVFLLVPLMIPRTAGGVWAFHAWAGGMYHLLSHALAKAAMFLAAGCVMMSIGSDRIRHFRGMAHALPLTTFAFGLAGVSLMGLPPSGGFTAKWFMVSTAIDTGQWWWAIVLLGGGVLTAVYIFLVLRYAFLPPTPPAFAPVPKMLEVTALLLALLALAIGFRAAEPFELLEMGTPFLEAAHHAPGEDG